MKKAVAYCRFSSDNQRTESIDAQVRAIEEYCKKEGYILIKIYKDEAISGTSIDDREEFLEMIEDSKNKEFNYVIVHKFDRFARNRYDHAINEKKLNENGVKLISVLEQLNDSPEAVILKSVLTGMNEYYSLNLAREVRKGQKENALKCIHNGGIPPLGYDLTEDKTYTINEEEAKAVRLIFKMYLEGRGYAYIADELNSLGFKNKLGKPFKKISIRDTLYNEKYIGNFIFGKKDKPAAYEEEEEDYQLKKSGRSNKVTPMRQPSTRRNAPAMEVCVIKPNAMDDTREITETLLAGRTVILNLEGMDLEIAQRIIDFTSGSAFAIDGNLQKISSYIFLVTPANVDISGDMQDLLNTSFDVPIQNRY
mgnify:CR=1 FL=1